MATLVGMGAKNKKTSEKDNKIITELKVQIAKLEEKVEETEKAKAILASENEELKAKIAKLESKNQ